MSLELKAVLAGLFFGIWPLLMNRSDLSGNVSSAFFGLFALIGVLPFAIYANGGLALPAANWTMVIWAGVFGAMGLLAFNGMLAGATPKTVSTLFVLMTVVQVVVAAGYQVVVTRQLSADKGLGYVAAGVAAYLLLR